MSVITAPGRMALLRTFGPKATASPIVRALSPDLAQA